MGGAFRQLPTSGVGKVICDGILNGDTKEKILEAIGKVSPSMKNPSYRIQWYRSMLKKIGALPAKDETK